MVTKQTVERAIELETREMWCGHFVVQTPASWRTARETGDTMWCPMGHQSVYASRLKELEDEVARQRKRANDNEAWGNNIADEWNTEKKAHSVTKGQLTKTQKRVANGVCPHCNRQFQNLRRHMVSKHR